MYPIFTINKLEESDGSLVIAGLLDRTMQGKERWIDDGWVGSLYKESKVAFGRWSQNGDVWRFRFDDDEAGKIELRPGEIVYAIDSYWGERVEIVLDDSIEWKESKFHSDGDSNHDHCEICWATISEHENTTYYLGSQLHPVCRDCYQNHVKSKNVSFVPSA